MAGAPHSPLFYAHPPPYPRWQGGPSEPAGRRFLKAFLIASIISLFAALMFDSVFGVPRCLRWANPWHHQSTAEPSYSDGEVLSCHLGWDYGSMSTNAPYTATASVTLPIEEATTLFFHSEGSNSQGRLNIVTADPASGVREDVAVIDIKVKYWNPRAWEDSNVCTMKRADREFGLGIYTHNWRPWGWKQLEFDVTATLPASQARPLILKAIETQLSLFTHVLGDLAQAVFLESVRLRSSNAHTSVKSVSAQSLDVRTSNAPITGSFNVTDRLDLVSSNGHIDVDIRATNDDLQEPIVVKLKTSNARIKATALLLDSEASDIKSKGSGFHILTSTSNNHLDITIPAAPLDSHLTYTGTTSNSPSRLVLPPAFEGKILSRTSNAKSEFHFDSSSSKDPSGQGRSRRFANEKILRGTFEVETWWGDDRDHTEFGEAQIHTSNGPVSISL
ncbi:hypothetical protein FRB95_011312 [Tulasnella sp. JGI-2019a]|nr:hypothetical protein FRB93_004635 [Tulasnella sp. JGI-2019a]KAG9035447.1 hypothetical protein FRB95_011312 [Tulasnella sp. JGI-2019a]